jgi:hypothetical protein
MESKEILDDEKWEVIICRRKIMKDPWVCPGKYWRKAEEDTETLKTAETNKKKRGRPLDTSTTCEKSSGWEFEKRYLGPPNAEGKRLHVCFKCGPAFQRYAKRSNKTTTVVL